MCHHSQHKSDTLRTIVISCPFDQTVVRTNWWVIESGVRKGCQRGLGRWTSREEHLVCRLRTPVQLPALGKSWVWGCGSSCAACSLEPQCCGRSDSVTRASPGHVCLSLALGPVTDPVSKDICQPLASACTQGWHTRINTNVQHTYAHSHADTYTSYFKKERKDGTWKRL